MRIEPLYRLTFHYPESWFVETDEGPTVIFHLHGRGRPQDGRVVWEPLPERPRYDLANGN